MFRKMYEAYKLKEFVESIRENDKLLRYPENYTKEDLKKLSWLKFKIVVPDEREKEKLCMALKYLHDSDIDTGYVWVNQIVHGYENDKAHVVVVDPEYMKGEE